MGYFLQKSPIIDGSFAERDCHFIRTGWRRPIGFLKWQVSFHKRAINSMARLQKITYKIRHPICLRHPVIVTCIIHICGHDSLICGHDSLICTCRLHGCKGTHTAMHCNALQHTASNCNALQRTATHCNTLRRTATHCNALQRTATHCNALQRTATHCNALQHTATHCNTLQRTATHCHMCRLRGSKGTRTCSDV